MRRAAVLILLGALAAAGCGGGGETSTATKAVATTPSGQGPRGELSEREIGSVAVGATSDQVTQAFGEPEAKRQTPGCQLAGPNAKPVEQWSWNLEDGTATLELDSASGQLVSYRTTSTSLPTTTGVRVGDSFQTLRDSYGPPLKPLDLGAPSTAEAGTWYVGKPGRAWLLFTVAGGAIRTIQGGNVQICE